MPLSTLRFDLIQASFSPFSFSILAGASPNRWPSSPKPKHFLINADKSYLVPPPTLSENVGPLFRLATVLFYTPPNTKAAFLLSTGGDTESQGPSQEVDFEN